MTHASAPTRDRGAVAAVLGTAIVMLGVGLWGLDRGSVWQDEQVTLEVASRTLPQIMALLRHVDAVHGAYYVLMHGWMALGGGEVWLRVPSVLGMAVAAGAVAALGVRLAGLRVGAVAGLLFAASPLVSFYAQEGRSFALVMAAVLLGTYALVQALATDRLRWWVAYAVLMPIAVVLHEFAVLAVAAHGVTVLLARVPWRARRRWLGAALLCALVVAPIAWVSQRQSAQVSWLPRPTWSSVAELGGQLFGSSPWLLVPVIGLVGLGVWAGAGRLGLTAVALPLLVVPVVVLLLASQLQPLFHLRYVLFATGGVPLLAAQGVDRIASWLVAAVRRPALGWVVAAVVVGAVAVAQLPNQRHTRTPQSRSNDLAAAAAVVRNQAQPGDAVIFLPLRYRSAALAYPEAFARVDDIALARTPVQAANLRGVDHTREGVRRAMLARQRVWVVGRTGLRVGPDERAAVSARTVLRERFRRDHSVRVHGMEVALYVRTLS